MNRYHCPFSLLNQRQATLIILINRHAIETLEALAVSDLAIRRNRLILAAVPAGLAGCTALVSARYPVPSLEQID